MRKMSFAICIVMMISLCFNGALAAPKRNDDFIYEAKGKGIRIIKFIGDETELLSVPSEIDGKPVKTIGSNAFEDCTVDTIVLPETISTIEEDAFYSSKCKEIIFSPNSKQLTITGGAFFLCVNLESLFFPSSVSFKKGKLGSICPFRAGNYLKNILIDDNNKDYELLDGILITKKTKELVLYPSGNKEKTIRLPDGIKSIGKYAMMETKSTDLIIPDSVTTIENAAFFSNDIERITIGSGVRKMGEDTFRFSRKLKEVIISEGTTVIGRGAFYDCPHLEYIIIPNSVKEIGKNAFGDNYKVKIIAEAKSKAAQYAMKNGLEVIDPEEWSNR